MRYCLYSGGLDSYLMAKRFPCEKYVFIDFGQKNKELVCAASTCPGKLDKLSIHPRLLKRSLSSGEQIGRNLLFISACVSVFGMSHGDILYAAFRDVNRKSYRDGTERAAKAIAEAVYETSGAYVEYPLLHERLEESIVKHKEEFPSLQFCNKGKGVNCCRCVKCNIVYDAFVLAGKENEYTRACLR